METHDHLYALGQRTGRDVFADAERLRQAMAADPAITGDVTVLVDAVRLGALRSLLSMLDTGVDVNRAIEDAGARLAHDRRSPDVAGARWACAVLAFAVGRVGDPDVRQYRHQPPPAVGAEPTIVPSRPIQAAPPLTPPTAAVRPQGFAAPPPTPAYGQAAWTPPPRKRKVWPIVLAVGVVVALVAGVGAYFVVSQDDDGQEASESDAPTSDRPTSDGPTSETTSDPGGTDFESVNQRYSALATQVTSGVNQCEATTSMSGQTEHLDCPFANGTLSLVTYASQAELEAGRGRQVTLEAGGIYEQTSSGTVLGFEVNDAEARPTEAFLYWDDNATQSATYVAEAGVDLDQLVSLYGATGPVVPFPSEPSDPELIDFVDQWFVIDRCVRIQTIVANQVEESYCDVNGPIDVYIGRFETKPQFRAYRSDILDRAKADGRNDLRTWNQQKGDPILGALYEYTTDDGYVARYWDKTDCSCYAEAFLENGTYERLEAWW